MKKMITLLLMACLAFTAALMMPQEAKAQTLQSQKPTADTLVNTDTAFIVTADIPDGSGIAGFQVVARRINGTNGGKVYLQESINGIDYVTLDSLTITNVARSTRTFKITGQPALRYRAQFTSTGTVRYLPELYLLRRRE